jgi:hypothetical protein
MISGQLFGRVFGGVFLFDIVKNKARDCSSVLKCLPSMHKALNLIPNPTKQK